MSTTITPAPSFELETYKPLDNAELDRRVAAVKQQLGNDLLILGHHYQQDEVIAHSDLRGDSYQLSEMAVSYTHLTLPTICCV